MAIIDTEKVSHGLRGKAIDLSCKAISITNYSGSEQEKDLTEPTNCNGFGRIRHFKLDAGTEWIKNPLPILPAAKALKINPDSEIRAQVFQNSICNWRCWYCYVDFKLLSGDSKHASFLTSDELVDLYLNQENLPSVIDLSGGQPDLTPEWIPWMMRALIHRGLDKSIYLWSDDNLSNDFFWKYLSAEQLDLISSYKMYSRVCCFKGIDENSFSLNTKAEPKSFAKQFELCKRILDLKIDLYFYITLTATTDTNFALTIPRLFDTMQSIHEMLPLRTVPLRIFEFTPVKSRMSHIFLNMLQGQYTALDFWNRELTKRFSKHQLDLPITEVTI